MGFSCNIDSPKPLFSEQSIVYGLTQVLSTSFQRGIMNKLLWGLDQKCAACLDVKAIVERQEVQCPKQCSEPQQANKRKNLYSGI